MPILRKNADEHKNGHSLAGYAITEIVPTDPTEEVREELGDLMDDLPVDANNNHIALCLDCLNHHMRHIIRDECLGVKQTKEKPRRNFDAATMLDKMYLEEQIEAVLQKILIESTDEITGKLEYTSLRVREKIKSNVPLTIRTESFMEQYYQFIKAVFAQMERGKVPSISTAWRATSNVASRGWRRTVTPKKKSMHTW